jgi:hypothetical protein
MQPSRRFCRFSTVVFPNWNRGLGAFHIVVLPPTETAEQFSPASRNFRLPYFADSVTSFATRSGTRAERTRRSRALLAGLLRCRFCDRAMSPAHEHPPNLSIRGLE